MIGCYLEACRKNPDARHCIRERRGSNYNNVPAMAERMEGLAASLLESSKRGHHESREAGASQPSTQFKSQEETSLSWSLPAAGATENFLQANFLSSSCLLKFDS